MAVILAVALDSATHAATGDQSPPSTVPAPFTPVGPVAEIQPATKIDPALPVPQEGIIVLRGGQVLRGTISRVGDRYHVVMPHGEIVVRTVEVESFCLTLEEAYRLKRSLMRGGNVYGHLALADWCLRNNLLDAVATELADAMAADPRNPMIAHLERRLQAALNPPSLKKQVKNPTNAMPSRDELDRLARAMPPGGMETFTAKIQPLLVNSCSTHECHGANAKSKFRLLWTSPGRAPSRLLTQRNLHAVMQWIDRENPTASPLLTRPIEPHGPKNTAIFDKNNLGQYRELVDWVSGLTLDERVRSLHRPVTVEHKSGSRVKSVLAKPGGVRQATHVTPWPDTTRPDSVTKGVKRAVFESPLPQEKAGKTNTSNVKPAENLQPEVERKKSEPEPVDPFDPAIFNRRYLPEE
ncbi:MAG: hypothetical protein JXM70_26860 [Pirellulales bacterium]|nr:hypothetical protein [Pirellulales bacterium]